ncbi:MAG: sensor domain-containing diguanylate cyclase [Oceanospirillaceae bacterium]|nr:sensor domain-containing diguanylate cyclase [Oceanospirillaceae bacterium]
MIKKPERLNLVPVLVGVVTCAIAVTITLLMAYAEFLWQRSTIVSQANQYSEHYQSIISKALAENLIVIDAVESLLHLAPNPSHDQFNQLMQPLLVQRPAIKQVELAPDAIIQLVYPDPGDTVVMGLDLRSLPDQRQVVEETIQNHEFRLAGPLQLVEGGFGAIARKPVYIRDGASGDEKFWGFITLILDIDQLLSPLLTENADQMFQYALRGTDGMGEKGNVFYGRPDVFQNAEVIHNITVPGGYWQLAVSIDVSTLTSRWEMMIFIFIGITGSLTLGILTGVMVLQWQRLHLKATHDSLTQVFNRQRIQEMGVQEVLRARRYKHPLSVIMIDLDGFKAINDSYGHPIGDQVLQQTTNFIEHSVRGCDLVGRYGGEEFVVILPECNSDEVAVVSERIRLNLCRTLEVDQQSIHLSASLGTATLRTSEHFGEILNNADIALYEAKRRGKNQSIAFSHHLLSL